MHYLVKLEGERVGRHRSTEQVADEAAEHIRLLESGGLQECWMCHQPLTTEHYHSVKQKLQAPIMEHDLATSELIDVQQQRRVAETAAGQTKDEEQRLSRECISLEANLQRCEQEITITEASLAANEALLRDIDVPRSAAANRVSAEEVEAAEERRTAADQAAGALSERLLTAESAASQVDAHDERTQALTRDLEGLALLKLAYSPSGIPRLTARAVMRGVAVAANTTMRRLGSPLEMRLAGFSGSEQHDTSRGPR